jgi:NAD(P)-dependent dehydrogenase (short-subunit alcohol dehydrogenase family)
VTQDLHGRVAVITGASRGLGAGLAVHFSTAGMRLGLCARERPALSTTPTAGTQALRVALDVTDHDGLEAFAGAVVERFGRIDLWVNNAGVLAPIGPLATAEPSEVARNIAVNVVGVLNGSAVFARHVRSRSGDGVLINISSGAAQRPYVGWAPYCAAKAAVDQLTRVVALEEKQHGLSAYAVAPGVVDTDMQTAVRASSPDDFPEVERFQRMAAEGAFNSTSWVADQLLQIAFGESRPEQVVVRIDDEPRRGDGL